MTDLHIHILPGVDDGSPNLSTSLEMAEIAAKSGVRILAVTPHANQTGIEGVEDGYVNYDSEQLLELFYRLEQEIRKEHIPISLVRGMEIMSIGPLNEKIKERKLIPLHESRYYLIEVPFDMAPDGIRRRLMEFPDEIKLVGVGKLLKSKGFDRIVRIVKRLKEQGYPVHFYVLGEGPERNSLQKYIQQNRLEDSITLLGYQLNPYKFVAKCDLFVCASYAEGFSTAATEALILGTPVCTVEVSGMKEMLGENNEYGLVVENRDEALYQGIRRFFEVPGLLEHYAKQAEIRGKDFSTEKTVRKVEKMLMSI